MNRDRLELLSPAGNIDIFKNVINAGADAVYFGGDMFGARAYAKNFSMEEGAEAISYAHMYGRKAFLTVNTLLKNVEIERKLYDYIKAYYEAGLDAVIVQDLGVLEFVKNYLHHRMKGLLTVFYIHWLWILTHLVILTHIQTSNETAVWNGATPP